MVSSQIRNADILNGTGIGCTLSVQGGPFDGRCCFNSIAWDFNGGKEWTPEVENSFLKMIDKPYIQRVTILGGEPLANQNVKTVLALIKRIKERFPNKVIWLYSGYYLDEIITDPIRLETVRLCDVLCDGRFEITKKDPSLKFVGSSNQRVIDMKKTLEKGYTRLFKEN